MYKPYVHVSSSLILIRDHCCGTYNYAISFVQLRSTPQFPPERNILNSLIWEYFPQKDMLEYILMVLYLKELSARQRIKAK